MESVIVDFRKFLVRVICISAILLQ